MRFLCLLVVGALCFGCDDRTTSTQDSELETPTPKVQETTAATTEPIEPDPEPGALSPDEPSTELPEFPTPIDLEEEARQTVAAENLEAELDRLEAEIVGFPD